MATGQRAQSVNAEERLQNYRLDFFHFSIVSTQIALHTSIGYKKKAVLLVVAIKATGGSYFNTISPRYCS
jgi:hypothetical protein